MNLIAPIRSACAFGCRVPCGTRAPQPPLQGLYGAVGMELGSPPGPWPPTFEPPSRSLNDIRFPVGNIVLLRDFIRTSQRAHWQDYLGVDYPHRRIVGGFTPYVAARHTCERQRFTGH